MQSEDDEESQESMEHEINQDDSEVEEDIGRKFS